MKICSNTQEGIVMLCSSIKLYLHALSTYTSGIDDDDATQATIEYMVDVQAYLASWLQKPDGFGNYFGGKNGSKIRDEVKVCVYKISLNI